MIGIVGIIALLTVLGLSLVVTRIATIALSLTGLSHEAARFQARSAFTGTGFTTKEAEKVVEHPVRRRIISLLMILRSAGIVSIIISLILSFAGSGSEAARLHRLFYLLGGLLILWFIARSNLSDKYLSGIIDWSFRKWTDLDTRDYQSLLKLSDEYIIKELMVREGDWVANKTLRECRLTDEGVIVLGIYRDDGAYVGAPKAETEIYPNDRFILYGRANALRELDRRRSDQSGQAAHDRAVDEQKRQTARQDMQEQSHKQKRESNESRR
jgi:hypothetical protein